jgi:TonB family protein
MIRTIGIVALLAVLGAPAAAAAAAADSIEDARELYRAASYGEALLALGSSKTPEAQEYRGLCLLALGRPQEAERVIEALITEAPSYSLKGEERPPRFVTLFTSVRARVLPGLVRRLFSDARTQYQAKAYSRARDQFAALLELAADPVLDANADAADIRVLASGFRDLAAAAAAPSPSPAPAAPVAVAAAAPNAPVNPALVVQPTRIRMTIPPLPGALAAARRTLSGAVRLKIGPDGRVTNAAIERPLHPLYDLELLAAARTWEFTPASLNGLPIEAEQIVPVQINPPERRR